MALFIPTYFAPIAQFSAMLQADNLVFEVNDNYQKQTYRNRCYIYGANGKQLLNIPIKHDKTKTKQQTKDIQIDYSEKWQNNHLRSLISAYKASPFFEFYIDDFFPIFEKQHKYLLDLNLLTTEYLFYNLQESFKFTKTNEYSENEPKSTDFRHLAIAKQQPNITFTPYTQVFTVKHGFIENLSILDLLFNEGPNTINLIQNTDLQ